MKTPIWLSQEAVLAMHADSIRRFGGSDGLRDPGLLASALARPRHLFTYEQADLCRLAAAYGHGIAKNHPFVDGNKRAAFLATTVFLERNGHRFTAPPAHAAAFMLGVADGTLDEEAFAAWLRENAAQPPRKARRGPGRRPRK